MVRERVIAYEEVRRQQLRVRQLLRSGEVQRICRILHGPPEVAAVEDSGVTFAAVGPELA